MFLWLTFERICRKTITGTEHSVVKELYQCAALSRTMRELDTLYPEKDSRS